MKLPSFGAGEDFGREKHSLPTSELKGFINDVQFFPFFGSLSMEKKGKHT
jgi:hypothetical protein